MIRERLSGDLKDAIKSEEPERAAMLRLICAAIKERDNAARADDNGQGVADGEIHAILAKMLHQRESSARHYEEGGQLELAGQERREMRIIREYLPRQFSDKEVRAAVDEAVRTTGARSIRDINKVMAHLKSRHPGRMDFARACATVKQAIR